jgi:cytoskeleton protein RodZ
MNQKVSTSEIVKNHGSSAFGVVFKQAREAKKLTIEDVSNAIHLSVKQVQALERNEFSALPEPMITRGFIRNYANFLELDYEPLLASYRQLVPNQDVGSIVVRANVNEVMSEHGQQPWLLYVLGSILVLLFLMAWFYYMDSMTKEPQALETGSVVGQVDGSAVTSADTRVDTQAVVPLVNDSQAPAPVTTELPPAAAGASGTTQNANLALNSNLSSNTNIVTPSNQGQVQQTLSNNAPVVTSKKIELVLSEASWVRVKDKSGAVIFEKTLAAGSQEGIDGEAPFNVIIGNAAAAKVTYLGREVDLTPSTSKNVVRLTLE